MAAVEIPFKDMYKEELLEALRLTRGNFGSEEYKSRIEELRENFLFKAIGNKSRDRQSWTEDQQQAWGRILGELRRYAVSGKFSSKGEDIGPEIMNKLVGFHEAQLIESVAVLMDATGLSVRSFSQVALRPLWEKGQEVLEKSLTSEKSEEETFLEGLGNEMTLTGAVKLIGDWLKGRQENAAPDAIAADLKRSKVEKTAPTPDPRVQLTADLTAAKAAVVSATSEGRFAELGALAAKVAEFEEKLAALPAPAATAHDPLVAAIAACEAAGEGSRLRVILTTYKGGGYDEEGAETGVSAQEIFVRRVNNILKKK